MATTTNYGWTTPDDTALVKDGAAAIRTLGSSVDTTTKNLNPETTLGDLAYRSSTANVKTRLALGTAGQLLQVNSGATAPEWATISTGAFTLLSTTTLSGASTTVSSISGAYKDLYVLIYGMTNATAGGVFNIEPNSNNAVSNQVTAGSGGVLFTALSTISSQGMTVTRTDDDNNFVLYINNYASTTANKPFAFYGGDDGDMVWGGGSIQIKGTAINALKFSNTGGTFSTGTVEIYGVK